MDAISRLQKELARITSDPDNGFDVSLRNDNLYEWSARIVAPQGSVYEGGSFELGINFPAHYPFDPPAVFFKTRIYHPNVNMTDDKNRYWVCIDILQKENGWTPVLTVDKVLLSISSLLEDPNPYHPLEKEVANQYVKNRTEFDKVARQWTQKYAK